LFQALRFPADHPVREMLRVETNPIRAKMLVKPRADQMVVKPRSEQDLENMRAVLRAKVVQHPTVLECLRSTGRRVIVEDCSRRASGSGLYWGAMRVRGREHAWRGDNVLGGLWMLLRAEAWRRGSGVTAHPRSSTRAGGASRGRAVAGAPAGALRAGVGALGHDCGRGMRVDSPGLTRS
jgi:predicted NAD-dependent protein-ADP-ribosyltransferase YbiA (DUF1768 family)